MRFLSRLLGSGGLAALLLSAVAAGAFAQEPTTLIETIVASPATTIDTGDTAWMLTSTALVLLMTIPGVALFYCGMVRKKNVLDVAMQSFATCCLITVLWFVIGYSLAFISNPNPDLQAYIGGLDNFLLRGMKIDSVNSLAPTIPEVGLHDLPDDVRDHHAGADHRSVR